MRSAKQTMKFVSSADHGFADINARLVENFTVSSPLAGWLKSVNVRLEHTDIDKDCTLSCMVSNFEDWGEIGDVNPLFLEIMNVYDTANKSGSLMSPNSPLIFNIGDHTSSNYQDNLTYIIERSKNIG